MAEEQAPVDKELDELLNSSAKQFAERPRTTDDELDELMNAADHKAAQKAATEFQSMLQQMVNFQEQQLQEAKGKEGEEPAVADEEAANQMIEAMKNLLNCTGKVANASSEEEFEAGLNLLRSPESNMEPFMHMIMQSLVSKEVMYPPLKEIYDKYPAYLEEHRPSLTPEELERYEKQYDILGKICSEFEKQPDPPADAPEATTADANGIAEAEANMIPDNFESMAMLLMELQTHGYPPKEITGELPEGMAIDAETGLPSFGQLPTTDACSII